MAWSGGARGGRPLLEVSDLVIAFDPVTGERQPVKQAAVVQLLRAAGDRRAAVLVGRLPAEADGNLTVTAVDELLIRMHTQLQRLWEELRQGDLAADLLRPLLDQVRRAGRRDRTLRVVDVGCGLGFFVRWAAATGALGPGVELVGCDLDPVLVAEARRLAAVEQLACRFEAVDAFALSWGADVFVSSGVLHHFAADQLPAFFARQREASGFVHWDPVPTYLSTVGSWLFHRSRMRDPLARHDGVRSVQRAHGDRVLLDAVAAGAPSMATALHGLPNPRLPLLDVVRPVIGVQPDLAGPFREALGHAGGRLVPDRGSW